VQVVAEGFEGLDVGHRRAVNLACVPARGRSNGNGPADRSAGPLVRHSLSLG
jgi:hypothetical protein